MEGADLLSRDLLRGERDGLVRGTNSMYSSTNWEEEGPALGLIILIDDQVARGI